MHSYSNDSQWFLAISPDGRIGLFNSSDNTFKSEDGTFIPEEREYIEPEEEDEFWKIVRVFKSGEIKTLSIIDALTNIVCSSSRDTKSCDRVRDIFIQDINQLLNEALMHLGQEKGD